MEADKSTSSSEIAIREPRLSPSEKLYVKAYTATLSHAQAYRIFKPGLKKYHNDNPMSRLSSVQYHIQKQQVLRLSSLSLDSTDILSLLLEEATRLGAGSSPTARVQALTLLGKELGLFKNNEKEEKEVNTFNIINYNTPIEAPTKQTEEIKQIEEIKEASNIDLEVTYYKE